jgi:5-methylcytosine-specific restriction endonuclease McrA
LALNNKALGSKKWKDIRLRVLARDGRICYVCGGEATQVDHIVPRTKMGDMWDMDNLAAICASCNVRKGNKQLGVFLAQQSTPPVLPDLSLPETASHIPISPFEKP